MIKVACTLLTSDRPQFIDRAVKCFLDQTYADKQLIILDSGGAPMDWAGYAVHPQVTYVRVEPTTPPKLIGELRNLACIVSGHADLIAHMDDDDYSHPRRIAEQVKLFTEYPGLEITGYRDLMFYDSHCIASDTGSATGELHLYTASRSGTHYGCGTSFMYRRTAWERKPFHHVASEEDNSFLHNIPIERRLFVSSVEHEPRMIAEIHGGNLVNRKPGTSHNWTRITDEATVAFARKVLGYA